VILNRKRTKSFVLLEVIISMLILAISMTAILRGFTIALSTIRVNRIVEISSHLAQSLLDDYDIVPPPTGYEEGDFSNDSRFGEQFEDYYWERRVDEEDIRYDDIPSDPLQEFEPIYDVELRIIYDNGKLRSFVPLTITTRLIETETFSENAISGNQLY